MTRLALEDLQLTAFIHALDDGTRYIDKVRIEGTETDLRELALKLLEAVDNGKAKLRDANACKVTIKRRD